MACEIIYIKLISQDHIGGQQEEAND